MAQLHPEGKEDPDTAAGLTPSRELGGREAGNEGTILVFSWKSLYVLEDV